MFGSQLRIGMDIGTTSVRAVEIDKKGNQLVLNKIGVSSLPDGTILNGKAVKRAELTEAIKKAVTDGGFTGKKVLVSVNPLNVVIRYLQLPEMTEAETREALKWELSKNVPFTGRAVYDFQTLTSENGTQHVMLVTAEEAVIDTYCSCIKDAGLSPAVVDIESLATARLISSLSKISSDNKGLRNAWETRTVILADIGRDYASLNFFRTNKLFFSRVIPFGSPEDSATDSFIDKFIQELKRSIRFYEVQHRDQDIAGIILSGEMSGFECLDSRLEAELGTVAEVLDPFPPFNVSHDIQQKAKTHGKSLSLALGLAMREVSK